MTKMQQSFNPWLKICTQPRRTIRLLARHNVNYRLIAVCAVLAFRKIFFFLNSTFSLVLRDPSRFQLFVFISALSVKYFALIFPLSIFFEYLYFNLFAASVFFFGKLIKGAGNFKEIRAAIYWTSVPNIGNTFAWIGISLMFFSNVLVRILFNTDILPILAFIYLFVQIFFGVWAFIIRVQAISEVQKFSVWMALLNLLLFFLAVLVIAFAILCAILGTIPRFSDFS